VQGPTGRVGELGELSAGDELAAGDAGRATVWVTKLISFDAPGNL
jgi:hypothetical protein